MHEGDDVTAKTYDALFNPRPDSPFAVTFYGPAHPPEGRRVSIPQRDMSGVPYVCTGREHPYDHYLQREGADRTYDWVGPCHEIAGPHACPDHPGHDHGHG
jgi:hypothetical protein